MPTYNLKDFEQTVGTGLGIWSYTVPVAGLYHVSAFLNFVPPSGIIVVIQQNSSTVLSSGFVAPSCPVINMDCFIEAAVSDVITIVVDTSTTPDLSVPTIKAVMNLRAGA